MEESYIDDKSTAMFVLRGSIAPLGRMISFRALRSRFTEDLGFNR